MLEEVNMRITGSHLRKIIREELSILQEASILSSFKQPIPTLNGTQIAIETADGTRKAVSKKLGVKVIKTIMGADVSYTFDISGLTIDSWTPDVTDGQPFMTVSFTVAGKKKTGIKLKNKVALKKIADAIISGVKAEGELIAFEDLKAAIIVNY